MKVLGKRSIASFITSVLDVAWWGIAIGLVLLLVLLAGSTFLELRGDNLTFSVPVAVQLDAPVHGASGETSAHFEKLQGNLRFPARQGAFLSGSVAVVVLAFGYMFWIVNQLRHVFRSLSQGLPFVMANGRRIRWIGLAVIFGEFGRFAIVYFWSYYTSLHFVADGLRFAPSVDINPITIVAGLAILVIAEVFQQGARLQEDQSLTI
ncbi:MAG: DUF2975 domain-containing protein [Acidobacteria bacterium]|nr:DUF2975 domain-containing protein [Acidobacteriota bacterium]